MYYTGMREFSAIPIPQHIKKGAGNPLTLVMVPQAYHAQMPIAHMRGDAKSTAQCLYIEQMSLICIWIML